MLAASFISSILPAIEYGEAMFHGANLAVIVTIVEVLSGAVGLLVMRRELPHEHFPKGHEGPEIRAISRIWLFVIAITLHETIDEDSRVWRTFSSLNVSYA